jgi:exopolyphosphatase/guanosine-5'-triphosphate,3'-diphosphate pyrophosphatase
MTDFSGAVAAARRIAVIDIGSNSIRLVVYDRLARAPVVLFNEKVMCGLGRGLERNGRLAPEGVRLALDNLARFSRLITAMGPVDVHVLATAAVRDAVDGAAFVAQIGHLTGLSVRLIEGIEEARLSAQGVLSGTPGADGLMGDLGGGSLELVGLDRGVVRPGQVTLPLGPFRLMEAGGGKFTAAVKAVDQALEALPWLGDYRGRAIFPVGGSWRAIAKSHIERIGHPLHIIHHYTADAAALADFAADMARQGRQAAEKLGVSRRRSDTLPYAALVLDRLIRRVQPRVVIFSAYGLREGLLYDLLSAAERAEDPLLSACASLAGRMGRFGDGQGGALAGWTRGLFAGEDGAGARLRQAACLLSDIGWLEHPDYRAAHGFERILRLPVAGIDHAGRAFLALSIFVRYGGRADEAPVSGLLAPGLVARAEILGLALRLAQTLTGGVIGLLGRTSLVLDDERLTLTLPPDLAALAGEVVHRRLDSLARAMGRAPCLK